MVIMPENKRNLPSLFTCLDGTEVTTIEQWETKRRPEILEMLRREEYGRLPDMSDVKVQIRVVHVREGLMQGRAIRKTVEVEATRGSRQFAFTFDAFIPTAAKTPVPAFIEICNRGTMNCDPAREHLSTFYPAETIVSRGYACAAFLTQEIAPDYDDGFGTRFHRLFPEYQENRPADSMGSITAWTWAASRILDFFETEPMIDHTKVAVVGHSRGGKTALWTGAQDQRFALAISSCAGNSGDAVARGTHGERIHQIVDRFPFWFADNYQKYAHNEEAMPFDQHFLLAMMAPRLVYVSTKTMDAWADPVSEFETLVQTDPIYQLYGIPGLQQRTMPYPEQPLHEGHIGHHEKTGTHDMDDYDWDKYLDYADRHLKGE